MPPTLAAGKIAYVVEHSLEKVVEAGGTVVKPLTPHGKGEAFATFRDPDENVLGVFQQP